MIVSRSLRVLAFCLASMAVVALAAPPALAEGAASPQPRAAAPSDPSGARGRNLVLLDSIVFVLGVGLLGGVLIYWGRRIYLEN